MRPLDRGAQRLLARFGVAAALEQVETLGKPLEDLSRGERLRPRGGELDGERKVVEPGAQGSNLVAWLGLRAIAEQRDRFGLGQWRHRVLDLALDAQQLTGRHEQREIRARAQERRKLGCCVDHLLEVVEQQQQLALADVPGKVVLCAERLRDRLGHERRVAQRRQPNPEDACLVFRNERRRRLQRKPRLARATRPGQRDQPRAALEPGKHLRQLPPPADERARRPRQVRIRDRLERRKAPLPELEDRDRLGNVLEPMLTQIDQSVGARLSAAAADTTTWPPCAAAAIRAARCTSNPT